MNTVLIITMQSLYQHHVHSTGIRSQLLISTLSMYPACRTSRSLSTACDTQDARETGVRSVRYAKPPSLGSLASWVSPATCFYIGMLLLWPKKRVQTPREHPNHVEKTTRLQGPGRRGYLLSCPPALPPSRNPDERLYGFGWLPAGCRSGYEPRPVGGANGGRSLRASMPFAPS